MPIDEQDLQHQIQQAYDSGTALQIVGGQSKSFYGQSIVGETVDLADFCGIVSYEPTELVVTVRAGTLLSELEKILDEQQQMLPFEPPYYAPSATIGGTIACGFSGPSRPYSGAARDYVLGCKVLTGKGDILQLGGQVMKNVAGYDVSRLMTGAMGSLGVLMEISLKVLPKPTSELTLTMPAGVNEALDIMNARAGQPLPLTAACFDGEAVSFRMSASESTIKYARSKMAGDELKSGHQFWQQIKEHQHYFFQEKAPLWRLSLPAASLHLPLTGQWFFDWGGAQRWLKSYESQETIRAAVSAEGGHACLFRGKEFYTNAQNLSVFHPLNTVQQQIHKRLKIVFDPKSILNPQRMY